jgi:hypothetical protein
MGCKGGLMDDAFDYLVLKQGGAIDTEAAYPYTGRAGTCVYKPNSWTSDSWAKTAAPYRSGASIGGWTDVPAGDEAALLDAVATVGPVSIAVDASIGWQLYFGGIMRPLLCSSDPKKMDHGVAIVGFGTEGGEDYWIVRNSWGAHWGEKGYARIIRGKNACGLANSASYPTSVTQVEKAPPPLAVEQYTDGSSYAGETGWMESSTPGTEATQQAKEEDERLRTEEQDQYAPYPYP